MNLLPHEVAIGLLSKLREPAFHFSGRVTFESPSSDRLELNFASLYSDARYFAVARHLMRTVVVGGFTWWEALHEPLGQRNLDRLTLNFVDWILTAEDGSTWGFYDGNDTPCFCYRNGSAIAFVSRSLFSRLPSDGPELTAGSFKVFTKEELLVKSSEYQARHVSYRRVDLLKFAWKTLPILSKRNKIMPLALMDI